MSKRTRSRVAVAVIGLLGLIVAAGVASPYFGYTLDTPLLLGLAGTMSGVLTAVLGAQFLTNGH